MYVIEIVNVTILHIKYYLLACQSDGDFDIA